MSDYWINIANTDGDSANPFWSVALYCDGETLARTVNGDDNDPDDAVEGFLRNGWDLRVDWTTTPITLEGGTIQYRVVEDFEVDERTAYELDH